MTGGKTSSGRKVPERNPLKTKHTDYLHILNDDRKAVLCAVSGQQILTVASESEELVVEGLEVRLSHHQALTYTQTEHRHIRNTANVFTNGIKCKWTPAVDLSHQGSLRWCIPKNRDDTRCRKETHFRNTFESPSVRCMHSALLTRCCSPGRWWILEGNVVPCAHRNTETPPHSDHRPGPYPLKHRHTPHHHGYQRDRERGGAASGRLPGHVQPSTHSSLQTSWMLRLWQLVEQDLVHSLYCIPIGHLGTVREKKHIF